MIGQRHFREALCTTPREPPLPGRSRSLAPRACQFSASFRAQLGCAPDERSFRSQELAEVAAQWPSRRPSTVGPRHALDQPRGYLNSPPQEDRSQPLRADPLARVLWECDMPSDSSRDRTLASVGTHLRRWRRARWVVVCALRYACIGRGDPPGATRSRILRGLGRIGIRGPRHRGADGRFAPRTALQAGAPPPPPPAVVL